MSDWQIKPEAILPTAIYSEIQVADAVGVARCRIHHEAKAGRLACKHIGRTRVYLGEWVLEWLRASRPEDRLDV